MRAGFRLLFFLLLSAIWLGGCSLLHPHRITNPNLPPGYKEQQKAARKARKDGAKAAENEAKARKKTKDPDTDNAAGTAPGTAPTQAAAVDKSQVASTLPDKSTVKFDKQGLMKKPKLKHRRYYKPAPKPFRPLQSIRTFFKKLTKRHGKSSSAPKAPPGSAAPKPDSTPAPVPTGLTP